VHTHTVCFVFLTVIPVFFIMHAYFQCASSALLIYFYFFFLQLYTVGIIRVFVHTKVTRFLWIRCATMEIIPLTINIDTTFSQFTISPSCSVHVPTTFDGRRCYYIPIYNYVLAYFIPRHGLHKSIDDAFVHK